MGVELGRISGQLLSPNLLRNGIDLAFESELLYLDVNSNRIGINDDIPTRLFSINGYTQTPYLIVPTQLDVSGLLFNTNSIQNLNGPINIVPNQSLNPTIQIGDLLETQNLRFRNFQTIENFTVDSDLVLDSTKLVKFNTSNVDINGNLHATGNITFDGNVIIGNNDTDSIVLNSDIASNIIPDIADTYSLGSNLKNWGKLYSTNITAVNIEADTALLAGDNLFTLNGKTIYVSTLGQDTNLGTYVHSTYRTLKYALSQATTGTEIVLFPGIYKEEFPLVVPSGVSIRGAGIRAVSIEPTAATNLNDAFLLNGETTISFLSVQNFYRKSTGNTGYAFKLANGFKTTTRSPYIQNVTVITKGIPLNASVYMDGWYIVPGDPNSGVYGQSWRILELIGTVNGKNSYQYVDETVTWNGSVWEYANIGLGILATGTGDTDYPWEASWSGIFTANPINGTYSSTDPLGYNQGTAGGGAYIDGSVANINSLITPSCLFYSTTFIVPNAKGIVATNRSRIEWLNSFTYYAQTGIELLSGELGFAGQGSTKVSLGNITGTISIGDTLTYYSDDEVTVLASGTVTNIIDDTYVLDGFVSGLVPIENISQTQYKTYGTACIKTANYKFPNGSLYLDGVGAYIDTADNIDFTFENNDFCIECWIYPLSYPIAESTIASHWGVPNSQQSFKVTYTNLGEIKLYLNVDGSVIELNSGVEFFETENGQQLIAENNDPLIKEIYPVTLNQWQHIAIVRLGDVVSVYINGLIQVDVTLPANSFIVNSPKRFNIGYSDGLEYFHGYIDEFRISRGSARFPTSFTLPINQYTADNYTATLLHFNDYNNSKNIVDSSPIIQNIQFPNATATAITGVDYSDFGSEFRSINSANVYGEFGATADGYGTLGYLVGHNFGYIGSLGNSENDQHLAVQANEVIAINGGVIHYESMDHQGDYRIGNIFFVSQQTGQVSFNAESIDFTAQGNIVFEGPDGYSVVNAYFVQNDRIKIHDNTIESLSGPVNFSAANDIILNTNVFVTGSIAITNDVFVDGNVYLGNDEFDLINIAVDLTQNIKPATTNTYTLGTSGINPKKWDTMYLNLLDIDATVQLTTNTLTTLTTNTDLELIASGTGKIQASLADVEITNNLTILGTLTVDDASSFKDLSINGIVQLTGAIEQTGNINVIGDFVNQSNIIITGATSYLQTDNISFSENTISSIALGTDLLLSGTNSVTLEKLNVSNNILSNVWESPLTELNQSIIFDPNGTGIVVVSGTNALQLPVGSNTTRLLSNLGEIRFNDHLLLFEGILPSRLVSFYAIYDSNSNTFITPELTPGTNDNIIRFGVNGVVKAYIDTKKLYTNDVNYGDISISDNTISTIFDRDIILDPNGSGYVNINDILLKDNSIVNTLDAPIILASTGDGYYKFSGTLGVVLPFGNSSERRIDPEIGETRYNTEVDYMEVWNGSKWVRAVGPLFPPATYEEVDETMNLWAFILG